MNDQISDETLMAYADGELEPQAAAEVERQLAESQAARQRLQAFNHSAQALRSYDAVLQEPVPPRLRDSLAPQRAYRLPSLALAASVALIVGLTAGFLLPRLAGTNNNGFEHQMVEALENLPSGSGLTWTNRQGETQRITPLTTVVSTAGEYCRQFTYRDGTQGSGQGVACREHGDWKLQGLLGDEFALQAAANSSGEGYVPASGGAAIDTLMRGLSKQPLDADDEATAIQNEWPDPEG